MGCFVLRLKLFRALCLYVWDGAVLLSKLYINSKC